MNNACMPSRMDNALLTYRVPIRFLRSIKIGRSRERESWLRPLLRDAPGLHEALQDQHRRHAVNGLGAFLRAHLSFAQ